MLAFRIADARHEIYGSAGAMLHGGRWNSVGLPVIYAAETYAGALLEVLAHANLSRAPANQKLITIAIPDCVKVETLLQSDLTGWNGNDLRIPRAFGDRWIRERRSAVLRVPGVVTGARENNLILNPAHSQFLLILPSAPERVYWDDRIFEPR